MRTFSTLAHFWQEFFAGAPAINGVDRWTIVFVAQDGNDILVSLADPFTDRFEEVFITNVGPNDLRTLMAHYKSRFMDQLPHRFGLFRPEVDKVLTEYPDWQTFYDAWLAGEAELIQGNMPLLFDYPSDDDYRAMRLKQADAAGYQRLLIVVYQYRRKAFQLIFVKQVRGVDMGNIQAQIEVMYDATIDHLILADQRHA